MTTNESTDTTNESTDGNGKKALKKGRSGKLFEAGEHQGTKTLFAFRPEEIVIDGLDNDLPVDGYNARRIATPLVVDDVYSIIRHGILTPGRISVRYTGDKKEVVAEDCRQRVRRGRQANEWIEIHNKAAELYASRPDKAAEVGAPKIPPGLPESWPFDLDVPLETVTVPCLPVKLGVGDHAARERMLFSLAANSGRVFDSATDLARAAAWALAEGAELPEICQALARDPQTVRSYLTLTKASSQVLKALDAGTIKLTAAAKIAELETKDAQNEALAEAMEKGGGKVTKEGATAAAQNAKAKAKGGAAAASSTKDAKRSTTEVRATIRGLEEDLVEMKKGSREYESTVAMISTLLYVLGEAYPTVRDDVEPGKSFHKQLGAATRSGPKLIEKDKAAAKAAPKSEAA